MKTISFFGSLFLCSYLPFVLACGGDSPAEGSDIGTSSDVIGDSTVDPNDSDVDPNAPDADISDAPDTDPNAPDVGPNTPDADTDIPETNVPDTNIPDTSVPETGPAIGAIDQLNWGSCDRSLSLGNEAECATSSVPLLWEEESGTQIDSYVIRFPASGTTVGQVWLLDGGPGGSGLGIATNISMYSELSEAGWDLLIPMHRGTGLSSALSCSDDLDACGNSLREEYGVEGLSGFSTTGAANDLAALVDAANEGQPTFLYGVSYGTFWAQRYLQLYPNQVQGVIIDGVLSLNADVELNAVRADPYVHDFLDLCSSDATCNQGVGGDPRGTIVAALESAEAGTCSAISGLSRAELEGIFATLIDSEVRALVMPIAAMMARCDRNDQQAIYQLSQAFSQQEQNELSYNETLGLVVGVNDILNTDLTYAEVQTQEEDVLIIGVSGAPIFEAAEHWPWLSLADYPREVGTTQTPVLLLQGGLDLATVREWADWAKAGIQAPSSELVYFPYSGHATMMYTNTTSGNCTLNLILQFMNSPTSSVDQSCVSTLQAPDMAVSSSESRGWANSLLGTTDVWRSYKDNDLAEASIVPVVLQERTIRAMQPLVRAVNETR